MNAELPGEDVSGEESLPETSEPTESVPAPAPAEKGFPWGIVVGGIFALGAVAVLGILFAKKKNGKVSKKS